jgi:hypothetical protein
MTDPAGEAPREPLVELQERWAGYVARYRPTNPIRAVVTQECLDELRAALAATGHPDAQQRLEWVATALHGDPMFGRGAFDPLVRQVEALRAASRGPDEMARAVLAGDRKIEDVSQPVTQRRIT